MEVKIDPTISDMASVGQEHKGDDIISIQFSNTSVIIPFSDRKTNNREYLRELTWLSVLGRKLTKIAETNIKVELKL